jgi:hypothetical protein
MKATGHLAAIANLIGHFTKIHNENEKRTFTAEKADPNSFQATYLRAAVDDDIDLVLTLRKSLTAFRADTAEGAIIQICEALNYFDEPAVHTSETYQIRRLMYSVVMFLEDMAGVTRKDLGIESLMSDNLNPWITADERIDYCLERTKEAAHA